MEPSSTNYPKASASQILLEVSTSFVPVGQCKKKMCCAYPVKVGNRFVRNVWENRKATGKKSALEHQDKVAIARGFHLFPFRTEKLSPSALMVLPVGGRVGRRPFFKFLS